MNVERRVGQSAVALETTLLVHGLPAEASRAFANELAEIVRMNGAQPAVVGVVEGRAVCGLSESELESLIDAGPDAIPKANTANLGSLLFRGASAATTVSATCEIAAATGVDVFATGGIGGVHRGYSERLDISSDLMALARFPVAVVASGVKSLLDVAATREALETLGVPCVGFGTDRLPAFYLRDLGEDSGPPLDARFDDAGELAAFVRSELARTGRGVLIGNPIPPEAELAADDWARWLSDAEAIASNASGRDVTPRVLAALHEVSGGATLRANLELVRSNTRLAAALAAHP
ncbi:MAG: pseudouridine-5'-phosphate glycosidase [Planctomycetota bacterium]